MELQTGIRLHNEATFVKESLDVDQIYDAIDSFSRAGKLVDGIDLELEASTEYQLGMIYYRTLKTDSRAKIHLRQCLYLAEELKPKDVSREDWHVNASKFLCELQVK